MAKSRKARRRERNGVWGVLDRPRGAKRKRTPSNKDGYNPKGDGVRRLGDK